MHASDAKLKPKHKLKLKLNLKLKHNVHHLHPAAFWCGKLRNARWQKGFGEQMFYRTVVRYVFHAACRGASVLSNKCSQCSPGSGAAVLRRVPHRTVVRIRYQCLCTSPLTGALSNKCSLCSPPLLSRAAAARESNICSCIHLQSRYRTGVRIPPAAVPHPACCPFIEQKFDTPCKVPSPNRCSISSLPDAPKPKRRLIEQIFE